MATITAKLDGSLELSLTSDERETYTSLPSGKVNSYLTLWMEEQKRTLVNARFNALTPQEKSDVLALLKQGQGQGRPP